MTGSRILKTHFQNARHSKNDTYNCMVTIVANFNLNHRRNFKPHLNFIFGMKIKSKPTFQIDIRIQIDLHFA